MRRPLAALAASFVAVFALSALTLSSAMANGVDDDGARTACRTDRYFVHVPTWEDPSAVPVTFAADLEAAMAPHIPSPSGSPVFAIDTVLPVLPTRPADERHLGETRFWQVQLDRRLTRRGACHFVDTLRTEAEALVPGTTLYVGRECLATGMAPPTPADPFSAEWHLGVMGKPAALSPGQDPADVALIDTGVTEPAAWTADPRFTAGHHPHGKAMADLVGQVDPSIVVADYRALDGSGQGDLADVALAIDSAVFEAAGPRVINLSVGWPPEMEQTRVFEAGACSTIEDPAGEAVRYALIMARLRDMDALHVGGAARHLNGPTAVIAAVGNRPRPFAADPTLLYQAMYGAHAGPGSTADPCSQPTRDDLFYPAQWARRSTCVTVGGVSHTLSTMALAIAATDHRDQPSALMPPANPPLLLAPGVHVWADGRRWTGSSVSTALVSSAIALAFGRGAVDMGDAISMVYGAAKPLPAISPVSRRLRFAGLTTPAPGSAPMPAATGLDATQLTPWSSVEVTECLDALHAWSTSAGPWAPVANLCPPFLKTLDQFSAGGAGPQPPTLGCPDCGAALYHTLGANEVDLVIELTSEWDPATTIDKPFLYVEWPDGEFAWQALPDSGGTWVPGAKFTVKSLTVAHPNGTLGLDALAGGGKMQLLLSVQTPKQTSPSSDVSDLMMTAY